MGAGAPQRRRQKRRSPGGREKSRRKRELNLIVMLIKQFLGCHPPPLLVWQYTRLKQLT